MNKRWVIAKADPALTNALARELSLPTVLAQVLVNRGFSRADAAGKFLKPQLRQLGDPFELPDMSAAVERILVAIAKKQRISIYGDYDVDGVTSSALLKMVLHEAGATAENFLPHRVDEGYGLNPDGVARCLKEQRPELLIAVDCGTTAVAEIAKLKAGGVDVVVLDHHEPPAELPVCVGLVNPKRLTTPTTPLASVGVAFKLAHALLKNDRQLAGKIDLRDHLDLVAVGTVADIVPLTGENRLLVKAGLERLPHTRKIGLRALMDVAAVPDDPNPYHIGFRIGPRLNAAGRLGDAMAALELLLTENPGRAEELANFLNDHNAERQRVEQRILEEALTAARQEVDLDRDRVIVLAREGWHVGVIGIVASRVLQEFYRPTVIIGLEAGKGKGSCRSIAGFSIIEALQQCAPLLEQFGGHEMAAGLSVKAVNVPKLREALNKFAAKSIRPEDLQPRLSVDAVVRLDDLDDEFFRCLKDFEPCGQDNPTPVFAVEGVRVRGNPRVVGKRHLKFNVSDGDTTVDAIWFGAGDQELPAGAMDVAFVADLNEFRGVETVQLKVKDVRPAARR